MFSGHMSNEPGISTFSKEELAAQLKRLAYEKETESLKKQWSESSIKRQRDLQENKRVRLEKGGFSDWESLRKLSEVDFYKSRAWQNIRYEAFKRYGRRCSLCGRGPSDGVILHVDHIKPRSKFPDLSLEIDNLQILCEDCNLGKGARDSTKWRKNE